MARALKASTSRTLFRPDAWVRVGSRLGVRQMQPAESSVHSPSVADTRARMKEGLTLLVAPSGEAA